MLLSKGNNQAGIMIIILFCENHVGFATCIQLQVHSWQLATNLCIHHQFFAHSKGHVSLNVQAAPELLSCRGS